MSSAAPLQVHITKEKLTIRDVSTLAVVAEIPANNFSIERISSGLLLTLNILVDSFQIDKGPHHFDLSAGAQE